MSATTIALAAGYRGVVELPGLKVALSAGRGPVDGDPKIQGRELYLPGRERTLLDAVAPSPRADDPECPRNVGAEELEERIISICDSRGEPAFLALRDRAQVVGALLKTPKSRLDALDRLMAAILGTRPDRKTAKHQLLGPEDIDDDQESEAEPSSAPRSPVRARRR